MTRSNASTGPNVNAIRPNGRSGPAPKAVLCLNWKSTLRSERRGWGTGGRGQPGPVDVPEVRAGGGRRREGERTACHWGRAGSCASLEAGSSAPVVDPLMPSAYGLHGAGLSRLEARAWHGRTLLHGPPQPTSAIVANVLTVTCVAGKACRVRRLARSASSSLVSRERMMSGRTSACAGTCRRGIRDRCIVV